VGNVEFIYESGFISVDNDLYVMHNLSMDTYDGKNARGNNTHNHESTPENKQYRI